MDNDNIILARKLARDGNLPGLGELLREMECAGSLRELEGDTTILAIVAFGGALATFQMLVDKFGLSWDGEAFIQAAVGNHVDVLDWLHSVRNLGSISVTQRNKMCPVAASSGSLEALKWARKKKCPWQTIWRPDSSAALATKHGHLRVLQYMEINDVLNVFDGRSIAKLAARHGHLHILSWLSETTIWPCWSLAAHGSCRYCAQMFSQAALGGHLEILEWLSKTIGTDAQDAQTCASASEGCHLHVLQWLRNQTPPCPWDRMVCVWAAKRGRPDILEWALENGAQIPDNVRVTEAAARLAAKHGFFFSGCCLLSGCADDGREGLCPKHSARVRLGLVDWGMCGDTAGVVMRILHRSGTRTA